MVILKWILTLPILAVCIYLASVNQDNITFTYSPFHAPIQTPVYYIALAALAAGFLFGTFLTWFAMDGLRRERRLQKKELKTLKKELENKISNDPFLEEAKTNISEKKVTSDNDALPKPY